MSNYLNQAAVLLAISEMPQGDEAVLLTLRAAHLSSHSGEVAFPGGKWEPDDPDLCYTALREASEEVGLAPQDVQLLSELSPGYTGSGVRVTPFVGRIKPGYPLSPNPDELDDLFWLPLSVLKADARVRTDVFRHLGHETWAPVYEHNGYTIWGFTARVLVEFVAGYCGLELPREHRYAPERRYPPLTSDV